MASLFYSMKKHTKYHTMRAASEGIYKEKGSKFIGIAAPCFTEDEAKNLIETWRKEHHQARHVCYAFRLGADKKRYRANDDGEPSNSAGPPILGQIESFDLTNVLIGVVRYYGGTKLGVGGLINAYRTAAKDAIENGVIVERELMQWLKITCDYTDMPHVMNLLKKNNYPLISNEQDMNCRITTSLTLDEKEALVGQLSAYASVEIEDLGIK